MRAFYLILLLYGCTPHGETLQSQTTVGYERLCVYQTVTTQAGPGGECAKIL